MNYKYSLLSFLFILQCFWVSFSTPVCTNTAVYTSTTAFSCSDTSNYIQPTSITNFPSGASALTIVAFIYLDSTSGGTCTSGNVYEIFSVTITSSGTEYLVASVVQTDSVTFKYRVGIQAGSYLEYGGSGSSFVPFLTGDWVEIKMAIDFANNQAVIASTFTQDFHFDAILPTSMDFNTGWVFDSNTKFYFGGRSGDPRVSVTPSQLTIWDAFLPTSTTPSSTIYPGTLLLGHDPVMIKEFLLEDDDSSYSIVDSLNAGNPAYLGASTASVDDTVNSPSWNLNRALKFSSSSEYIRIPGFSVATPNNLILASLTLNFWIKITATPSGSTYIFQFSDSTGTFVKFGLKYDSSLALNAGAGDSWGTSTASGLTIDTWHQVTVTWMLRSIRSSTDTRCYYSIHVDNLMRLTWYISTAVTASYLSYVPSSDKVIFGGFEGVLGQIQIFSPGALQIFDPSWCSPSTCGADLGATNPPTCTSPSSCHSSCDVCVDGSESGCLSCSAAGKFYEGKCVSPCPAGTYTDTYTCEDCADANCEVCSSTICLTCYTGYEVNNNGKCVVIPESTEEMGIAQVNKVGRTVAMRAMKALNIVYPFSTMPFVYGTLSKNLQYTRYMNISRSTKLEELYQESLASVQLIPTPMLSDTIKSNFVEHSLPYMFEKYELPSSFLVNFGDDLLGILTFAGVMVLFWVMKWLARWVRNIPGSRFMVIWVKVYLQNYLLGQVFESFGDVMFYSVMELRTLRIKEKYSWVSLVICLVCMGICALICGVSIWITRKYQNNKEKLRKLNLSKEEAKSKHENFNKKHEGVMLLYEDFEDENFKIQAVMMYYSGYNILFSLIIALLVEIPLMQLMFLLIMDSSFLIFFAVKKPIKSKLDLIEVASLKFLMLIAEISLLIMASVDVETSNPGGVVDGISNVLIALNMIFTFCPYLFMALKLSFSLWELCKEQKRKKILKKKDIKKMKPEKEIVNGEDTLNNLKQDTSSIIVGNDVGNDDETIGESALIKRITKVSLNDGWAENAGSLIFSKKYMDTKRKRRRKMNFDSPSINEL